MRPQERDVTLVLYQVDVRVTEDSGGDEPYMWILGFKTDADTLGPPASGSLLPTLGVKTFEGAPAMPWLIGDNDVSAPATLPIPAALGTRSFRLRPALLPTGGWFPGLAGMVCLLWDQDAFSPSTSEAGHKEFNKVFGPALSTELTSLINGGYDDPLSRDANDVVVSTPAGLQWRLDRLADAAARKNAVKAITKMVRDAIYSKIHDALADAAGLDEGIDPDDLLGVDAVVYLGDELSSVVRDFELKYTDDEADYLAKGHASSTPVHLAKLDSAVTAVERTFDRQGKVKMRVCWYPEKEYSAFAYRVKTTTRYELLVLKDGPIAEVRWFIGDQLLTAGEGSVTVMFEAVDAYVGPPQDLLASFYTGGNATLKYRATGTVLEVWNENGNGVFFGTVRAVYAYAGDPPLTPPGAAPKAEDWIRRGYDQSADLSIMAVELQMDSAYQEDIKQCKRIVTEIDRKHIAVNFGKVIVNPGDPPPFRQAVLDRVTAQASIANAADVQVLVRPKELR
jgi:hypothetical protein